MHSEILARCRWYPGSDVHEFFAERGGYVRKDHRDLRRQGPMKKREVGRGTVIASLIHQSGLPTSFSAKHTQKN
jgi:hypothetical protein